VHQYEEYVDPGYFPGHANAGVFKSDSPRHYPMNRQTTLCINTALGYPFYIAPIVFPKIKWLGLAPMVFGLFQAVDHGVIMPSLARVKYSPGFLAAILLHVPIGITYIQVLRAQGPIGRSTWNKTIAAVLGLFVAAVLSLIRYGFDKNTPYPYSAKQMGPYDAQLEE
jgi:hypothetical protein